MRNQSSKHEKGRKMSYEYVRGLVDGEGCFTFQTNTEKYGIRRIPHFTIVMDERDENLLRMVRNSMGLRNKIYNIPIRKNGEYVGRKAVLSVRDFKQIKDIVIPFFYMRLKGYKGTQFIEWIEKFGSDPDVPDRFKSLYRLYKWGAYDKEPNFTERFKD
jgi:hypothetical protein